MFTRKILLIIILVLPALIANAQEFNCQVTINDEQLEGTSFEYVKQNLENEIMSYINEYRWTEVDFQEEERISCVMSIVLTSGDSDFNFSAETVISARRPIYNTMSETTTMILSDQSWVFSYPEGKNLTHNDLEFEPLTGFIDFYAYLLLGYDFDSFSDQGGTVYFGKAQDVVDLAQSTSATGWSRSSNNRRNRFVLISDLLNTNYQILRTAFYTYHRHGLDLFTTNPEEARQNVIKALTNMRDAKRRSTSTYLYDLFFDTKSREISSIFEDAESTVQLEAYNILRETDQAHLSEYDELQN
ncbi:MAG TPA: DUF4835 domain-containing protein [Balneolaceae bacterium]|nr:DUF4835 domain-containing protein [Balneolaceae bacterium]